MHLTGVIGIGRTTRCGAAPRRLSASPRPPCRSSAGRRRLAVPATATGDDAATSNTATKGSGEEAPAPATAHWPVLEERGARFTPGAAFYRGESAQARDLAVLAAAAYRRRVGGLRVLDVMAGSGVRAARYISEAGADFVWWVCFSG